MPFGGGARGPVDAKGLEPILHVRSIEAFMSTVCALSLENAFYVLQSIIIIMDFKDFSNKNGNVFFEPANGVREHQRRPTGFLCRGAPRCSPPEAIGHPNLGFG